MSEISDEALLVEIERAAIELVRYAGAVIEASLGRVIEVQYKSGHDGSTGGDPVSEVDREVEMTIRERVAARFPGHGVLGEEGDERPGRDHDFVWSVDPIDGTTNFVNGFPLFASSIGVLYRGRPVVGALWCSTTHALRTGVYHARTGSLLHFDGEVLLRRPNPVVRRALAGAPRASGGRLIPWDTRTTGSAALECAFVAAGLLRIAYFAAPNVWDVAAGIALVAAAGGEIHVAEGESWEPFTTFLPGLPDDRRPELRDWRRPLLLGDPAAVATNFVHQRSAAP